MDLYQPNRQSKWAIVFIILQFIRSLASQFWFLLIPIFLGRGRSTSSWDIYEFGIAGLGVFSAIWSVIAYYRFFFQVNDKELIIKKGIINKVDVNIPFERIQAINFRQNILHRLLKVTEVEVDTAGSTEKEISLKALTFENANLLRNHILKKKATLKPQIHDELALEEKIYSEPILNLSNKELVIIGLSKNHFKLVSLLIGLIVYFFFTALQLDLRPWDMLKSILSFITNMSFGKGSIVIVVIAIISVIYSLILTFINYSNLQFFREFKKFKLVYGLFTKKEVVANDNKIQFISWSQNILQKYFSIYEFRFLQAKSGSFSIRRNSNLFIPGCSIDKIEKVRNTWFKDYKKPNHFDGISYHLFYYNLRYILTVYFLIFTGLYLLKFSVFSFVLIFIFLVLSIIESRLRFRKKKYYIDQNLIEIKGGSFGHSYTVLPTYKVQNVSIKQNLYQIRRGLADLVIYTAGGRLIIPFIDFGKAKSALDYLVYHVELSNKNWM